MSTDSIYIYIYITIQCIMNSMFMVLCARKSNVHIVYDVVDNVSKPVQTAVETHKLAIFSN